MLELGVGWSDKRGKSSSMEKQLQSGKNWPTEEPGVGVESERIQAQVRHACGTWVFPRDLKNLWSESHKKTGHCTLMEEES